MYLLFLEKESFYIYDSVQHPGLLSISCLCTNSSPVVLSFLGLAMILRMCLNQRCNLIFVLTIPVLHPCPSGSRGMPPMNL